MNRQNGQHHDRWSSRHFIWHFIRRHYLSCARQSQNIQFMFSVFCMPIAHCKCWQDWKANVMPSDCVLLRVLALQHMAQKRSRHLHEPDGLEHWGDLHPDWALCKERREQLPVLIHTLRSTRIACSKTLTTLNNETSATNTYVNAQHDLDCQSHFCSHHPPLHAASTCLTIEMDDFRAETQ